MKISDFRFQISDSRRRRGFGGQVRFARVALRVALVLLVTGYALLVPPVSAQIDTGLNEITNATGLGTTDIRVTVGRIINVFLGLLGAIAVILILTGGFLWMTAGGNEEKIAKAKQLLLNASIGLAIILSAFSITYFIFRAILGGVGTGTVTGPGTGDGGGGRRGGGGLGGGIVQSHYPTRNAVGIPRNTKIIITFKEEMDVATLIDDKGTTNDKNDDVAQRENVLLRKTIANPPSPSDFVALRAATTDGKNFTLTPTTLLGSASEPISYTIRFADGLKKKNGDKAFGRFGTFYEWVFEVSTIIDTDPPRVISVLPGKDTTQPRNAVIQVNLSEAVDPTVVVGDQQTSKLRITTANGARVGGMVNIANQYQTLEFTTDDLCGKNSCGGDVFCLPADSTLTVLAPSAALTQDETDSPFSAVVPYAGIVDLAGNALDGNEQKDATGKPIADGPGAPPEKDDYTWTFATNDTIDLTPPVVASLDPPAAGTRIPRDKKLRIAFSKPLMSSTFNAATVKLEPIVNYWTETELAEGKTIGIIAHDPFDKNTEYAPAITAGIKDLYQNCYFPCAGPNCTPPRWEGYPSCSLP